MLTTQAQVRRDRRLLELHLASWIRKVRGTQAAAMYLRQRNWSLEAALAWLVYREQS